MDDNEIKITTGEGAGPAPLTPVEVPPVSAETAAAPAQPEFLAPDSLGPSPIPPGVEGQGDGALKKILMVLLALIFIGGVGALGYFVVFPLVFPAKTIPAVQPPVNQPPQTALAPHQSYLTTPPASVSDIKLSDFKYLTIATALQNESFNQLADGQFKEIKFSGNKGQVPFVGYLEGLSPALTALGAGALFEDDFTALLYYDAAGVWPIYISKLKSGVTPESVTTAFKQAEGVMDLANFYISSPGVFKGFKGGKLSAYSTRYNVGSQSGASFNYGMFGNYFIISANFNGLKGVLPLLGL